MLSHHGQMVKPKNLSDLWVRDPLIHSPILGWRRARRQIIPSTATCHGHGRNTAAFSHGTWKRFHGFSMKILSLKKNILNFRKIYHGQKIALWHGHPCHSAILWKNCRWIPADGLVTILVWKCNPRFDHDTCAYLNVYIQTYIYIIYIYIYSKHPLSICWILLNSFGVLIATPGEVPLYLRTAPIT